MKNFIKKLVEKIKSLFNGLRPGYKKALKAAVAVVDAIYQASNSPVVDIITVITPTVADDKLVTWLRNYLPDFLKRFKLFAEVSELTDPQEIIVKVSEILQSLDYADRNGERLKLAVALAIDITADGKLDWADAVKIIQALKDKSIQ